MTLASLLGEERSPLKATLMLSGMYPATLEIIPSTLIGTFRMLLSPWNIFSMNKHFAIECYMILNHVIAIEVFEGAGPRC
jgi:hypothetical protein